MWPRHCGRLRDAVRSRPLTSTTSSAVSRIRGTHSPSTRRLCSSRISSAMLVRDSRTSSANGAFGRHERQLRRECLRSQGSAQIRRFCCRGIQTTSVHRQRRASAGRLGALSPHRDPAAAAVRPIADIDLTAASRWRSSVRRSIPLVVRQGGTAHPQKPMAGRNGSAERRRQSRPVPQSWPPPLPCARPPSCGG